MHRPSSTPTPTIMLTGFMGVGKSAVGREVAARLGRAFVDLDDRIEAETGMTIPAIFAQRGEPYFRQIERDLLQKLAVERNGVFATGGGALVDVANRELAARSSLLICLDASAEEIAHRLQDDTHRPLLAAADRRQRMMELMQQRAPAYAEIPYHIDTTGRSVSAVADAVVALATTQPAGVLRLPVAIPGVARYDILIGAGLLDWLPHLLAERKVQGRAAVVMDEHVAALWGARLHEAFGAACGAAQRDLAQVVVPAGEEHKRLSTVARIYDGLLAAGIDRSGVVIALGGGVVGDMAGFAAATYLRGIAFVQVPSTLLAMVDASVGGKTGVDLPQGKNLVGAFKQPEVVVIDPDLLHSLPQVEFRNGLAEVIKHGLIADPALFAQLESGEVEPHFSLIARALRVKIGVVQRDPFEAGERAHLNLGHTFAHALEQVSGYTIPHGQAVGLGLLAAAELAATRAECAPAGSQPHDLPQRIATALARLGLPTSAAGLNPDEVLAAMATDKKRLAGRLRFVLPHAIGSVAVHDDVTPAQVLAALGKILV